MKGIVIEYEIDGYLNGEPYHIIEYDEKEPYWERVEFSIDDIKHLHFATPIEKLVWIVINYNSYGKCDDGIPMYLFHITPGQISEMLGVTVNGVEFSLNHLIRIGRLKKYDIENIDHVYAAI